MEPRDRAAQEVIGPLRSVFRLAASCLVLVGLALAQAPGFLVSDTKLDLAVAPARFLGRAAHLWDPMAAGGQLQNQAYGYLWPMGPFFWLGSVLDVPEWAVQRLWLGLVLCVAFVGAALLARALGVRSDVALILGGFAYALSPRMLTVLGSISIEAWPSALAPWVLLPLVMGSQRGSPRRAAAWSAVAVAIVGGVNAAATFAVIPLGAIWLLTRTAGARRRSMMLWWPVFVLLGTAWWLVPLFLLGAYSPPFLDFIESAHNTTFPTTLFDSLRGTSDWVPYVDRSSLAGNDLIRLFHLPLLSSVVLGLGIVGLLDRRNPHRQFLALSAAAGVALVTAGHLGAVQGWGAVGVQALLDGALAPLRNVHKFDPVVRLPLVLGLAWTVDRAARALRERPRAGLSLDERARLVRLRVLVGVAVVAVLGAAMPALTGRITPAGAFLSVPDYWKQAASWLGDRSQGGQALLAPGSSFGEYAWGVPRDEPLQPLARGRWAVRNAVPLTPPGNIRMLDAVEARFAQGRGSTGLAAYLRRAGVGYVVVRNDLARLPDIPDPVLVHQALAASPGIERVATFGPDVGGDAHLERHRQRVLVNGGWQTEYPAIEIFRVAGSPAFAVQSGAPPVVVGGPEDLLDLADLGVLGEEPTKLAADTSRGEVPRSWILTDGLRDVERNFGRVHDGTSETRVPGEQRHLSNPSRDYLLPHADQWSTTAYLDGARSVTASSSMSDASAIGTIQPGQQPYAAIDGRGDTFWRSSYHGNEEAWWRLDLEKARSVGTLRITAGPSDREVVRVQTAHRSVGDVVVEAGASRQVRIDDPDTTFVRVADVSGRSEHRLTLAEVAVPGLAARRGLRLPAVPRTWGAPEAIALRAVADARRGCVEIDHDVRCVADRDVTGEEESAFHRRLSLPSGHVYRARLRAVVAPGPALARAVLSQQPVDLNASSTGSPDPRASTLAAIDGDPGTTWTAALTDTEPVLTLNWVDRRRLSGVQVRVAEDTAAKAPTKLLMVWPGGRRTLTLDKNGNARFPAFSTRQVTFRVLAAERASSLGFDSTPSAVPVGISELRVTGLPYLPVAVPTTSVRFPCGAGPTLVTNGVRHETSVQTSYSALLAGTPTTPQLCGTPSIPLHAGTNEVSAEGSSLLVPRSVVLDDGVTSTPPAVTGVETRTLQDGSRLARPSGSGDLLVLRENQNPGWVATQHGRRLTATVADGWQQAWRIAPDGGPVKLVFAPDAWYRAALVAGFVALLLLVGLTVGLRRRTTRTEAGPADPRDVPGTACAIAGLVWAGVVAGWPGVLVGAVALAGAMALSRWRPAVVPWAVAALVVPAGAAYALRPWGGLSGWAGGLAWPHYLVVAVVVALVALSSARGFWRPRSFRRRKGFSTRR